MVQSLKNHPKKNKSKNKALSYFFRELTVAFGGKGVGFFFAEEFSQDADMH